VSAQSVALFAMHTGAFLFSSIMACTHAQYAMILSALAYILVWHIHSTAQLGYVFPSMPVHTQGMNPKVTPQDQEEGPTIHKGFYFWGTQLANEDEDHNPIHPEYQAPTRKYLGDTGLSESAVTTTHIYPKCSTMPRHCHHACLPFLQANHGGHGHALHNICWPHSHIMPRMLL